MTVATAPGKLMLAREAAVLDGGGRELLVAVNRRVVGRARSGRAAARALCSFALAKVLERSSAHDGTCASPVRADSGSRQLGAVRWHEGQKLGLARARRDRGRRRGVRSSAGRRVVAGEEG